MIKPYRPYSLRHRRQILQVNIRLKALDEFFKIYTLLHLGIFFEDIPGPRRRRLSRRVISGKGLKKKSEKLPKICEIMRKSKSKIEVGVIQKCVGLIDLVKSFQTNIYLQKSASYSQERALQSLAACLPLTPPGLIKQPCGLLRVGERKTLRRSSRWSRRE